RLEGLPAWASRDRRTRLGSTTALLCAAACSQRILSRARNEPRFAVPALWIGRLPLFDGPSASSHCRAFRSRLFRQSSGLGCAAAQVGMWRLDQSRTGTCECETSARLGLWKFRVLVASPNLWKPQSRTHGHLNRSSMGRPSPRQRSTTSRRDLAG